MIKLNYFVSFFNVDPWFYLCNRSFFFAKLQTSLWHFLTFILFGESGRSFCESKRFFGYSKSTPSIILYLFINSLLNRDIFFFHLKLSIYTFWDIAHLYRLLASHYMWLIFILVIIFPVFIISWCISMHCMTYFSSYALFYH